MKMKLFFLFSFLFYAFQAQALTESVVSPNSITSVTTRQSTATYKNVKNVLGIGFLGSADLYTLNYERLMSRKVALGIGYSRISLNAEAGPATAAAQLNIIPIHMNYYFPFSEHRPFIGGTMLFIHAKAESGFDLESVLPKLAVQDANGKESVLKVETQGGPVSTEVNMVMSIPILQAGYEYRNTDGAVFQFGMGFAMLNGKSHPIASLSGGVGF